MPSSERQEVSVPEMSLRQWSVREVAGMAEGGNVVAEVFGKGLSG